MADVFYKWWSKRLSPLILMLYIIDHYVDNKIYQSYKFSQCIAVLVSKYTFFLEEHRRRWISLLILWSSCWILRGVWRWDLCWAAMCLFGRNNALPGQKSNTLEMKQIGASDWEFINFEIKRSPHDKCHNSRKQMLGLNWDGFGSVINRLSLSESSGHWIIHRHMRHCSIWRPPTSWDEFRVFEILTIILNTAHLHKMSNVHVSDDAG